VYIDLFSGCGGLSLGLHKAGLRGMFAVEKNHDAFSTLKYNLIDQNNHFDWPSWLPDTNLDINQLIINNISNLKKLRNKVLLIVGGPPCQGFSMAGRRQESDERNLLVKSYIEFIKIVKPEVIFFENVRGFMVGFTNNGQRGNAYSDYIIFELKKLGYDIEAKILDFSMYGVPQRRQRFILVGTRKGIANDFFMRIDANKKQFIKSKNLNLYVSVEEAISDLLQSNGTVNSPDTKNFKAGIYGIIANPYQKLMRKGVNLKIADSHRFANHKDDTIKKFSHILSNSVPNKNISHAIRAKYNIKKRTIIPLCSKSVAPTLTTHPDDFIHYCEPRILTVREYARIQSFPDSYCFKGKYTTGGVLRKQDVPRYTQIGNAIPPLFAEQVGLALKDIINEI